MSVPSEHVLADTGNLVHIEHFTGCLPVNATTSHTCKLPERIWKKNTKDNSKNTLVNLTSLVFILQYL